MGLARFIENQLVRIREDLFKLIGKLPDGDWHLVDVTRGFMEKKPEEELWSAFAKRDLVFVENGVKPTGRGCEELQMVLSQQAAPTQLGSDSEELRQQAMHRWNYVKATLGLPVPLMKEVIAEKWKELKWPTEPPHVNTIFNWRKRIVDSSDPVAALTDKHHLKGWTDRYDEIFLDEIRAVRDEHFLKMNPRITVAMAVKKTQARIRAVNAQRPAADRFPVPGRRLVQTVINEISSYEQYAKRYGRDAAAKRFRYSLGGIEALLPLDRCEIDHTPLSVILADDDFIPWGRAQCSVALDTATGCPTGTYWGAECPSIVSVSRAMRYSVEPKVEFMKQFSNVRGSWACFGVAKNYIADNGLEEHASALRQAVAQLGGSVLELCGRGKPWFKPNIERYFRNQDLDFLQTLPGATMENFSRRCNFNPKKDLILRRSTFGPIYMKWLVDIYLRESRDDGKTPAPIDCWHANITKTEQFVATNTVLLERLFLRRVPDRVLDHAGVEYDCLTYNSADMGAIRTQLGAKLGVTIWVSDEDLGHIQVQVPETDYLIRVPCLELKYADGLTRWQHTKNKDARRVAIGEGRQLSLDQARQEIDDAIRNELSELRHAHRKRRSRYQEKDPRRQAAAAATATPTPSAEPAVQLSSDVATSASSLRRAATATTPTLRSFVLTSEAKRS